MIPQSYKQKFIIFALCVLTLSKVKAQGNFSDNLQANVNYHAGVNLPEYNFMSFVTTDYIQSVDVNVTKHTHKGGGWEQLYNYPSYGLSLFYSTLGNDEILGKELALNPFVRVNYISRPRFNLYNQLGLGFSYVSKRFAFEETYLNVAAGSHFNIHFNLRLGTAYNFSNKLALNLGISFDHFSNANTREPNLGINYVTLYGGLGYLIGNSVVPENEELEEYVAANEYAVYANFGGKRARGFLEDYFATTSATFEWHRKVARIFHLGAGVDVFYDASIKSQLQNNGDAYTTVNSFQSGIHISQTFVYNRLRLALQEGVYVLPNVISKKGFYNKGIVQYSITEHIAVRMAMKAHLYILDYPEIGLGYLF